MYVPCSCFTCGAPIGDLEDIYRAIYAKKVKVKLAELVGHNEIPTKIAISSSLQISCEEELNKLHIYSYCCITHLTTSVRFSDKY